MELDEIKYNEQEEFNQFIDDEYPEVEINGEKFLPSEILFNLKKEAYRIALTDFETQQFDELKQIAFESFPSNFAYYYRLSDRGVNANNPVFKFLHLKDTWEAAIYILNALAWGEVRAKGIDLKTADVFHSGNPNQRFNSPVLMTDALKQMLENVKAIVNFSNANGLNLKCGQFIKLELIDALYELQNNRNHFSHAATPTPEQANAELTVVLPLFKKALKHLRFLEDVIFLRFESFNGVFRFQTFKDHSLNREFEEIEIEAAKQAYVMANAGEVIFAKWDDDIFSCSPFLHYIHDGTGHETYLCVYKGKADGQYLYEPVKQRGNIPFPLMQVRFAAEKLELQNLIVP